MIATVGHEERQRRAVAIGRGQRAGITDICCQFRQRDLQRLSGTSHLLTLASGGDRQEDSIIFEGGIVAVVVALCRWRELEDKSKARRTSGVVDDRLRYLPEAIPVEEERIAKLYLPIERRAKTRLVQTVLEEIKKIDAEQAPVRQPGIDAVVLKFDH